MRRALAALSVTGALLTLASGVPVAQSANQSPSLMADQLDVSPDFRDFANSYYVADSVVAFDPATRVRDAQVGAEQPLPAARVQLRRGRAAAFRGRHFSGEGIRHRSGLAVLDPVRHAAHGPHPGQDRPRSPRQEPSLMLAGEPPVDRVVAVQRRSTAATATRAAAGSITILEKPVAHRASRRRRQAPDAEPRTRSTSNRRCLRRCRSRSSGARRITRAALPRCCRCRPARSCSAAANRSPGSTSAGRSSCCRSNDANGAESDADVQADPVLPEQPRLRHVHAHDRAGDVRLRRRPSTAATRCCSATTSSTCSLFLGTPKEILDEYTALTGKSPMPPLWSFGFWMSRITYISEEEVRDVAAKLRRIPNPRRRDPPRHRLVRDRLAHPTTSSPRRASRIRRR